MGSILKLINKYFWKGIIGPVFSFIIPMLLVLFMGRIMGPTSLIPGLFLISPLCILLVFMPQSVFEFRNSSLLKRIGTTPIKPWMFLLGISIFNFIIVICSFIVIFLFSFLVFIDSKDLLLGEKIYLEISYLTIIKNADWASFTYFFMLIILICILIGLFIASIGKSTLFVQCTGIGITLISLFVGPAVLPISIAGSTDVVKYLGYLLPLKYPFTSAIEAFTSNIKSVANINSSTPWNINADFIVLNLFEPNLSNIIQHELINNQTSLDILNSAVNIASRADKILNLVMPWFFILLFSYFVIATFKWSNRGKSSFNWKVFSSIISSLRLNKKNNGVAKGDFDSEYILEINNLTKKFKTKDGILIANNNISFKIKKGRHIAILGHNGAGKTVLVETIVGVTHPEKGNIKYNFKYDKSFNEKIGIQFQDSSYPFGISVKDIINFFIEANNVKMSKQEFNELIDKFGIKEYINKNASSLSGGQQQRINLLLSVIHKPKLIFLDELSTGLDIKIRNDIKEFIKKYAYENDMTIVIVSHDINELNI